MSVAEKHIAKALDGAEIHFETYGDRSKPAILMGPHFYVSRSADDEFSTDRWIEALQPDFFLIMADYPRGIGRTGHPQRLAYTPDLAAREYELIADSAGVGRFGWLGYSFGAAMGVQVACRSARVTGLAAGGFPPLNAPFQELVEIHREWTQAGQLPDLIDPGVIESAIAFYQSLISWPERDEIPKLTMPKLVFMGDADGTSGEPGTLPLAHILRTVENELRALGWRIEWLKSHDHMSAIQPDASLSLVREFFLESLEAS
jgi:pimeloyl-ACP methyl ester carboxylesterase